MKITFQKTKTTWIGVYLDGKYVGAISKYSAQVHVTDGGRLSCGTVKDSGWKSESLNGPYGRYEIRERTRKACAERLIQSLKRNGAI